MHPLTRSACAMLRQTDLSPQARRGKKGALLLRDSRDIIRRLLQDGFEEKSVSGSHHKFVHKTKHLMVIVPHPKRDLPPGTVRDIYKHAGWQKD
jgi:predicted RNA binding protein YcfA (HicA-like mRNA interferase family)